MLNGLRRLFAYNVYIKCPPGDDLATEVLEMTTLASFFDDWMRYGFRVARLNLVEMMTRDA